MKAALDIESWPRKDHFNFFKQFEEPFFGVCISLDCTEAYKITKEKKISFFLYYLHKSLLAANQIEPFRYRISNDQIYVYDEVHASPTITRPDNTFGFAYIDFNKDFKHFEKGAKEVIEKVQNSSGLVPAIAGENIIHYSSIPWINFTAISHARSFYFPDSCPKISFGKMTDSHGKKTMPVSIHVHHALMDGFHVGQFIDRFQELMNDKYI